MVTALFGVFVAIVGCVSSLAMNLVAFGVQGTRARFWRIVRGFLVVVLVFAAAGWSSVAFSLGELPDLVVFVVAVGILIRRRGRPRTPEQEAIAIAMQSPRGRMAARAGVTLLALVVVLGFILGVLLGLNLN